MRLVSTFAIIFLLAGVAAGQGSGGVVSTAKHKVVFQLTSSDTLVQKALMKQINHLLVAAPNSKIEVVCHSNGITLLQRAITRQATAVQDLKQKGVDFAACENTMRDRNIKKEDLIPACRTVPSGMLEIVMKQEKHWAYVKAGF
jgi:hypothetical protein